jgi:hypothetical protein
MSATYEIIPGKAKTDRGTLVVRIPLTAPAPSSTGKTLTVASTHGNQPTGLMIDGQVVKIGLTAFIKPGA